MRTVSTKLTDEEFQKMEVSRGEKTTSNYLRGLILQDAQKTNDEVDAVNNLLADIAKSLKQLQSGEGKEVREELNLIKDILLSLVQASPAAANLVKIKYPELIK